MGLYGTLYDYVIHVALIATSRMSSFNLLCVHLKFSLFFPLVAANILCEFLEVTFHLILYIREVYPAGEDCT